MQRGMPGADRIRVLIIEDEEYALFLLYELTQAGYAPLFERVNSVDTMKAALAAGSWDMAIAGFSLPDFNAFDALWLIQEAKVDLPLIAVSLKTGENVSSAVMMAGARDIIRKNDLARLIPVIERERRRSATPPLTSAPINGYGNGSMDGAKRESLELLASGVAHDFNNLLAAILGQCSIALDLLPSDSPAIENLQICIDDAERAAGLTRRLISYAGHSTSHLEPNDLNELVRENVRLLTTVSPAEVQLQLNLLQPLPPVKFDPSQLQKALMTLVTNASNAIGPEPGRMLIATGLEGGASAPKGLWSHVHELKPGGRYVTLSVSDTGTPLTEETLSKIFDPFFTTEASGRGNGLGALIATMRQHQGGLRIQSDEVQGTTFTLILPETEGAEAGQNGSLPDPRKGKVLVIDDEAAIREAVSDILELQGIEVLSAADGCQGVEIFQSNVAWIDLVLLDHKMPGMSGQATLEKLLEIKPDARVLMTSGLVSRNGQPPPRQSDKVGFLPKPFNADRLTEAVADAIGYPHSKAV